MLKKAVFFISATFLSTCLLFLLLEGVCFILGFPQGASDFVERTILQQKLDFRKPSGQYRIFLYGESTIHGAGYWPVSSPGKWLDAYLKDFLPGRDIKVVNFGRLGEGSDFITRSFLDTLQYKPDLAIFYVGHNTFYPANRVDAVTKSEAELTNRLRKWFRKSRLISAVVRETIKRKIKRHSKKSEDVMGNIRIETVAYPFSEGNENITLPGSPLFLANVRFFEENIGTIIHYGKQKHTAVVFMKPVCNLKDYYPNLSLHLKPLREEEKARWDALYRDGQEALRKKDDLRALELFEKAFAIDPTYADLAFRLGQLYFQKGDLEKAKIFFVNARDTDAVIRRAPHDILNVLATLTQRSKVEYFDTEKALISKAPGGILGWPVIEDNVHFSLQGHALAARALADQLAQNGRIAPRAEWRFDRERSAEEIKKELGVSSTTIFNDYCSIISYLGCRYEDRLEFAHRALAIFPDHPLALRQLAWAYWLNGEKDKALKVYKQLDIRDPAALQEAFHAQPQLEQAYKGFIQTNTSKSVK